MIFHAGEKGKIHWKLLFQVLPNVLKNFVDGKLLEVNFNHQNNISQREPLANIIFKISKYIVRFSVFNFLPLVTHSRITHMYHWGTSIITAIHKKMTQMHKPRYPNAYTKKSLNG